MKKPKAVKAPVSFHHVGAFGTLPPAKPAKPGARGSGSTAKAPVSFHHVGAFGTLPKPKPAKAVKKAKAKKAKKRGLTPGGWDSCVADALGCGPEVFLAAGGDPDGGAWIEALLEEMAGQGLIVGYAAADLGGITNICNPLVLGVDLPGPHAVYATADGWWSWGQLWQPSGFPDVIIEEAWTVNWC